MLARARDGRGGRAGGRAGGLASKRAGALTGWRTGGQAGERARRASERAGGWAARGRAGERAGGRVWPRDRTGTDVRRASTLSLRACVTIRPPMLFLTPHTGRCLSTLVVTVACAAAWFPFVIHE